MSRGGELLKNTGILLAGNICTRAISFLLLPLYTAYLSESQYGVVDLVMTLIMLMGPVIGLQLEQAIFRFIIPCRGNAREIKGIVSSAMFAELLLLGGYSFIFVIISPFIHFPYKWFLISNVVVSILNSYTNQIVRGLGKNAVYAIASIISSILTISCNILFIAFLGWGAYGMLLGMFIGISVALVFSWIKVRLWTYISIRSFNRQDLKELLRYSVPLIPNELSWWAIKASDRVIISAFLGLAANGIISVAHKFPEILITMYNVFGLAWTESIVLHFKESDGMAFFSRMTNTMFKFFSSLALVIVSAIPLIFRFFINAKFDSSYNLLPLYIIGAIMNITIGLISVIYIVNHKTGKIAKTSFWAAVISIGSCVLMVKYLGVYASPLAFILGYGTMLIYRIIDIQKYVTIKWDRGYVFLMICTLCILFLFYYSDNILLYLVGFMFAILFGTIFNYSQMKTVKSKVVAHFLR